MNLPSTGRGGVVPVDIVAQCFHKDNGHTVHSVEENRLYLPAIIKVYGDSEQKSLTVSP